MVKLSEILVLLFYIFIGGANNLSIRTKANQFESVSEGEVALSLFTDRTDLRRLFLEWINDTPEEKIIFLKGEGGNGKSLLLKYLKNNYNVKLPSPLWERIKNTGNIEFTSYEVEENAKEGKVIEVPTSFIDFSLQVNHQPLETLLAIRRNLSGHGIKFYQFDYACIWYFFKSKQLTGDTIKKYFPAEEFDILNTISDYLLKSEGGNKWMTTAKAVLSFIDKHAHQKIGMKLKSAFIDEEKIRYIQNLDFETDLLNELPSFLATDLNNSLETLPSKRILMLFDTHEALFKTNLFQSDDLLFERDKWLRKLLLELDINRGIIVALTGRDVPKWNEAPHGTSIPNEFLEIRDVGDLSFPDAQIYLGKLEITNEELVGSILSSTESIRGSNYVHPFYLALSADVVLESRRNAKELKATDFTPNEKKQTVVQRFFRYTEPEIKEAIIALSTCRFFDWDIYLNLGTELHFITTKAAFDQLISFSFVHKIEDGKQEEQNKFKIHDLLRHILSTTEKDKQEKAHVVMTHYYKRQLEDLDKFHLTPTEIVAFEEAWFHSVHNPQELTESVEWLLSAAREFQFNPRFNYFVMKLYRDAMEALMEEKLEDTNEYIQIIYNLFKIMKYDFSPVAEVLLLKAVEKAEKNLDHHNILRVQLLEEIISFYFEQGKNSYEKAIPYIEKILKIFSENPKSPFVRVKVLQITLKIVAMYENKNIPIRKYLRRNNYEWVFLEAEKFTRLPMKHLSYAWNKQVYKVGKAFYEIYMTWKSVKDIREKAYRIAKNIFEFLIKIQTEHHDEEVWLTYYYLGHLYRNTSIDKAIEMHDLGKEKMYYALGQDHPNNFNYLLDIVHFYKKKDLSEKAKALCYEIIEICDKKEDLFVQKSRTLEELAPLFEEADKRTAFNLYIQLYDIQVTLYSNKNPILVMALLKILDIGETLGENTDSYQDHLNALTTDISALGAEK